MSAEPDRAPQPDAARRLDARGGGGVKQGALLFAGLALLSLAVYVVALWLAARGAGPGPAQWLSGFDAGSASETVASAAEVVAGVLAIAITVVAIVVELAANRYTHRITQLFTREPVNVFVMGFFVLTALICLWMAATIGGLGEGSEPRIALATALVLASISLLLLLPYFGFVFRFLSPVSVIRRIRDDAVAAVLAARDGRRPRQRERAIDATEELEDVARTAMQNQDLSIAMASVDALCDLLLEYGPLRAGLPDDWFAWDGPLPGDPHFVSMAPTARAEMCAEGAWFETKVMRQGLSIYGESLGRMPEIANLLSVRTRQLADAVPDDQAYYLTLYMRLFNSYLRQAINARQLRTGYYVLHQYRQLAEGLMARGRGDLTLEIAEHLRSYGLFAFEMGQGFLLEVVAWDVSLLLESAAERQDAHHLVDPLLELLLRIDKESDAEALEASSRGVRRAQAQVATFFLARGDEPRARRVYDDMRDDRPERLAAIRDELEMETREQYWEFNDRGVNFRYLPPERRAHVGPFFDWFGERLPRRTGNGSAD